MKLEKIFTQKHSSYYCSFSIKSTYFIVSSASFIYIYTVKDFCLYDKIKVKYPFFVQSTDNEKYLLIFDTSGCIKNYCFESKSLLEIKKQTLKKELYNNMFFNIKPHETVWINFEHVFCFNYNENEKSLLFNLHELGHDKSFNGLYFDPKEQIIVFEGRNNKDKNIYIYEYSLLLNSITNQSIIKIDRPQNAIIKINYLPEKKVFIVFYNDISNFDDSKKFFVHVYNKNLESVGKIQIPCIGNITTSTTSLSGKYLALGFSDPQLGINVQLIEICENNMSYNLIWEKDYSDKRFIGCNEISSLAFSPDNQLFAVGNWKTLEVFRIYE